MFFLVFKMKIYPGLNVILKNKNIKFIEVTDFYMHGSILKSTLYFTQDLL